MYHFSIFAKLWFDKLRENSWRLSFMPPNIFQQLPFLESNNRYTALTCENAIDITARNSENPSVLCWHNQGMS